MPLTGMELKQILKMLEEREKKHIEQEEPERQAMEPDKEKQRASDT